MGESFKTNRTVNFGLLGTDLMVLTNFVRTIISRNLFVFFPFLNESGCIFILGFRYNPLVELDRAVESQYLRANFVWRALCETSSIRAFSSLPRRAHYVPSRRLCNFESDHLLLDAKRRIHPATILPLIISKRLLEERADGSNAVELIVRGFASSPTIPLKAL